jgi:hypothetical protein
MQDRPRGATLRQEFGVLRGGGGNSDTAALAGGSMPRR